jgi:hypothetical protein
MDTDNADHGHDEEPDQPEERAREQAELHARVARLHEDGAELNAQIAWLEEDSATRKARLTSLQQDLAKASAASAAAHNAPPAAEKTADLRTPQRHRPSTEFLMLIVLTGVLAEGVLNVVGPATHNMPVNLASNAVGLLTLWCAAILWSRRGKRLPGLARRWNAFECFCLYLGWAWPRGCPLRASGHTCRRVSSAQSSGMSEVAIYRA